MTKNSWKNFIITAGMAVLFILFTLAIEFIDVTTIWGEEIGFASVNLPVHKGLQTSETFSFISDILGLVSIAFGAGLVIMGLVQLIKRKSIKKVDKEISIAGIVFVLMAGCYLFFEVVVVNCRPVLVDGELEASYPSSHTLLSVVICVITIIYLLRKVDNKKISLPLTVGVGVIGFMQVITRTLSGMHWLTDIIGAVLLASVLVLLYYSCITLEITKKTAESEEVEVNKEAEKI